MCVSFVWDEMLRMLYVYASHVVFVELDVYSHFFFSSINHVDSNVALNFLSSSLMSDLQKAILDKQVGITC